jgi:hypothetical protein
MTDPNETLDRALVRHGAKEGQGKSLTLHPLKNVYDIINS